MANLINIIEFLEDLLDHKSFNDVSLNGLQIEGKDSVNKIAVSVDAALETAQIAASLNTDLLISHHGLFWGKPLAVSGAHKECLSTFLNNNLSLFTSHLPLDAHMTHGNNILLANLIGLSNAESAFPYDGQDVGCLADNSSGKSLSEIIEPLKTLDGASNEIHHLAFGPDKPSKVGICSGSAADLLYRCEVDGFDTFITGESKQFAYHFAKEHKLNVIFAGHYATETLGVKSLAAEIEKKFGTPWEFINCPTGI